MKSIEDQLAEAEVELSRLRKLQRQAPERELEAAARSFVGSAMDWYHDEPPCIKLARAALKYAETQGYKKEETK